MKDQIDSFNEGPQGKGSFVPAEIKKWNWGAFLLNAIWGLGNKTYVALLSFVPFFRIVMIFVLSAKGSEWAWWGMSIWLFCVILTFILVGTGTIRKTDKSNTVAEVGQYHITFNEYRETYETARSQYKHILGEKFDGFDKDLNLKAKVLDFMIEKKLLLIAAKDLGIKVTDEELRDAITHMQVFKRDGKFDKDFYLKALQHSRMTPEAFENAERQTLTLEKMRRHIVESVYLTELSSCRENKDDKEDKDQRKASRKNVSLHDSLFIPPSKPLFHSNFSFFSQALRGRCISIEFLWRPWKGMKNACLRAYLFLYLFICRSPVLNSLKQLLFTARGARRQYR